MAGTKLKTGEVDMLRRIAIDPRTAHSMTHVKGVADVSLAPGVIHSYLHRLTDLGLIEKPLRHDGKYAITDAGREYLTSLPQITPSTLIANASMKEPYRSEFRAPARGAGCMRAYSLPSRGIGT